MLSSQLTKGSKKEITIVNILPKKEKRPSGPRYLQSLENNLLKTMQLITKTQKLGKNQEGLDFSKWLKDILLKKETNKAQILLIQHLCALS